MDIGVQSESAGSMNNMVREHMQATEDLELYRHEMQFSNWKKRGCWQGR